jgi:hypothetical protein
MPKIRAIVSALCNSGGTLLLDKGGFGIKHQTAITTFGIFRQFVGEDPPFLATGGTFDLDFVQGLVAFKPWTMLVTHVTSFLSWLWSEADPSTIRSTPFPLLIAKK